LFASLQGDPMSRSRKRFLSLMVPFALGAAVQAQDAAPTAAQTLPKVKVAADEESTGYTAISTQTATRTDTALRDVPQAVTVITRQAIDDQNMQNLADVVRYVPGIGMAQGEGNRETPVFRGSSSTADFFIDGMRDDVQYYRDLYNIEQVEALKGPNGMIFGRGGVGGVINRVSKVAGWTPVRQLSLQAGTFGNRRGSIDMGQGINDSLALRVNGMYEDSDSYRDDVTLERYGINPTVTYRISGDTRIIGGVEYFRDERVADRGVSSFQGRPLDTHPSTFFGDPESSPSEATVKSANLLLEHQFSDSMQLRNRTRYADYDKFYQNVFPGAVNAAGTTVALSAYNNATQRENIFNQTDLVFALNTGAFKHTLLTGLELGRQESDNFRNTGFFDSQAVGATSVQVPLSNPRTTLPVNFRQNATDANNTGTAEIAAVYVQDQIELSSQITATLGLRYDQFKVDFTNNRTGASFDSDDDLISPRVGLVYKPVESVSLYASYSKTFQPRAGEQLASLTVTNQSLDPEEFRNYEVGVKWDVLPTLAFTTALYDLERTNVAITDPNDITRSLLVDGQRVRGVEIGVNGNVTEQWSLMAAYAYQDGEILSNQSATVREGARLASVPENTFSLWNRYDFSAVWGVGLGVIYRSDMFAAIQNIAQPASNVTLESYTRVDAALFYRLNASLRAQANVENVLGEDYYVFAHSNTNITPGSPRALRASIVYNF
jgi:catecholate siderophore receptor